MTLPLELRSLDVGKTGSLTPHAFAVSQTSDVSSLIGGFWSVRDPVFVYQEYIGGHPATFSSEVVHSTRFSSVLDQVVLRVYHPTSTDSLWHRVDRGRQLLRAVMTRTRKFSVPVWKWSTRVIEKWLRRGVQRLKMLILNRCRKRTTR